MFITYVIILIHIIFFSSTSNCKECFIKEEYSPNKAIKAVYYEFDCGATSGRSHHVKITDLSNKNEKQVFSIDGIPESDIINISWINDKHLVLEYQDNDNEDLYFSKNNQWDIKIDYNKF